MRVRKVKSVRRKGQKIGYHTSDNEVNPISGSDNMAASDARASCYNVLAVILCFFLYKKKKIIIKELRIYIVRSRLHAVLCVSSRRTKGPRPPTRCIQLASVQPPASFFLRYDARAKFTCFIFPLSCTIPTRARELSLRIAFFFSSCLFPRLAAHYI